MRQKYWGILVELNDLPRVARLYQEAFDHYQVLTPSGTVEDSPSSFGSRHIIALADFYNSLAQHEKAINTIRAGARWLDGRRADSFWDAVTDDREFSAERLVGESLGENSMSQPPPGEHPLDPNMRHRLAIARLRLGHLTEGKVRINLRKCVNLLLIFNCDYSCIVK
jgi:general transcription factor 3C polypeptide 3 (transcription factor C subunit 4)